MVDNIYQVIDDTVYSVIKPQSLTKFNLPREVVHLPSYEADSTVLIDKSVDSLAFAITINTIPNTDTKGNNAKYNELVEFIKEKEIKAASNIGYNYKVIVDYSVFDDENRESRAVVVKSVDGKDLVNLIPNPENNTVDYRRVKLVETVFNFYVNQSYNHKIITGGAKEYTIRINKVSVYQNLTDLPDSHESNYNVALETDSKAVTYLLTNHIKIYESSLNAVRFNEVRTTMKPNMLSMHIKVIVGGFTDVFNNEKLSENFKKG